MMLCVNCQKLIDDNSQYCKYCGHEYILKRPFSPYEYQKETGIHMELKDKTIEDLKEQWDKYNEQQERIKNERYQDNSATAVAKEPKTSIIRIAVSYIAGVITFIAIFALTYGMILTILQILNLEFLLDFLSFIRKEPKEDILTIISTVSASFAMLGIVNIINKNKPEHINTSLVALSVSGIAINIISLIFNIIGSYGIFINICFIISNVAIYRYAKNEN